MSLALKVSAEKFVRLFDQLEAGVSRLPDGSRLSVVDNGYIANKLETRYPRMRYLAFLQLGNAKPEANRMSSEHLQTELEALGVEIMEILGDLWVCDLEMVKRGEALEVRFSLPILGGAEVVSDPLPAAKAKQFLKLGILYGDVSQFGVDLECGSIKKLGSRALWQT